jgi:tRNA threonylcarbamoyl adenosine modification protein YjeE
MKYLSSEEDTKRFASELAALLPLGISVGLEGDLGSGKTTFVRHFTASLGITTPVSSPTYVLQHEYLGDTRGVEHWDLYRLSSPPEELLEPPAPYTVRFVEWPSHAGDSIVFDLLLEFTIDLDSGSRTVRWSGTLSSRLEPLAELDHE